MLERSPWGVLAALTVLLFGAATEVRAAPDSEPARADRVVVCLLSEDAPPGLEPDALRTALAIEARKSGLALAPCREDAVTAIRVELRSAPGPRAIVRSPDGGARTVDVADLPPIDRAAEVAHVVLRGGAPEPQVTLGAAHAPRLVTTAAAAATTPAGPATVGAVFHVGGRYDHAFGGPGGAAGLEVDATVRLGSLWAVGVQALWQPARDLPSAGETAGRIDVGGVAAVGRLALPLGPLRLRPAIGVGAEWRAVSARDGAGEAEERASAVVLLGELDLTTPLWRWLWLGVGGGVRGYLTGTTWRWREATIYEAPRIAVGGAVRVGGRW